MQNVNNKPRLPIKTKFLETIQFLNRPEEPDGKKQGILKMEKNKVVQSRREFFKTATKKALPILGAIALFSNPVIAKAVEEPIQVDPTGCNRQDCTSGCIQTCTGCQGTCKGDCTGRCSGACRSSCTNTCTADCQSNCSWSCTGSCKTSCLQTCSGACTTSCSGRCDNACSGSCGNNCSGSCLYGCQHWNS